MEREKSRGGASPFGDIPDPFEFATREAPAPALAPRTQAPTRGDLKRRRALAAAVWLAWPLVVLASFGLRDRLARVSAFVSAQAVLWIAVLALALFSGASAGSRGLGLPAWIARAVTIGAPLLFVVVALFWLAPGADEAFGATGPLQRMPPCLGVGSLVALPLLFVSIWALRHSFTTAAGWRGAALGAGCGFAAALVLLMHCGVIEGGHIALAHGAPLLLTTWLGAIFGVRWGRA
jgi:hypothetical protein